MPGNPHVRFDEGRVGRTARCRPLSYSTGSAVSESLLPPDGLQGLLDNWISLGLHLISLLYPEGLVEKFGFQAVGDEAAFSGPLGETGMDFAV